MHQWISEFAKPIEFFHTFTPLLPHFRRFQHWPSLAELNADYDTSRHDMDAHLTVIQQQRQSIRVLLMAARANILHLTTPEEWEQIQRRSNTLVDWLNSDEEGL